LNQPTLAGQEGRLFPHSEIGEQASFDLRERISNFVTRRLSAEGAPRP